ncbi:MAG: DUF4493 domain-containing protein [Bacteroidales bacterium]|nr:DUF4493 domain-containing protein [Bacteroidales bacterium]
MRKFRFLYLITLLLVASCFENESIDAEKGLKGEVSFILETENRSDPLATKVDDSGEVSVDAFLVEIVNENGVKFFRERYKDIAGKSYGMNAGDYVLTAHYGDSLTVGFNHPYYVGTKNFTVHPEAIESVSVVAKLGNLKFAVEYGPNIQEAYQNFFTVVRNTDYGKSLRFSQEETRYGYMPAGNISVEVYADLYGDGNLYQFKLAVGKYSASEFVKFTVDIDPRESSATVKILVDDAVNTVEKVIEVPAAAAVQDPPKVTLNGFDSSNSISVMEGTTIHVSGVSAGYYAPGKVESCILQIESAALQALGVPQSVDLANLNASTTALLNKYGICFGSDGEFGFVDISGFVDYAAANVPYDQGASSFTFKVTDQAGRSDQKSFSFQMERGVKGSIAIEDYNVWAKKIVSPVINIDYGDPNGVVLQYSADGKNWTSVNGTAGSGKITYPTITGLQPGTQYQFRAKLGERILQSITAVVTTEQDAQVGNASMENWQELLHHYEELHAFSTEEYTIEWWLPYLTEADSWWSVNSKISMPSTTTISALNYKVMPCVGYSVDAYDGTKSAVLNVVNVSSFNTAGTAVSTSPSVGELFIGVANDDGSHKSDGHAFPSRPSTVKFKYKATMKGSEKFVVSAWVKDANGNVIATGSMQGSGSSSWATGSMPLTYSVTNKKAASIYISFKASNNHSVDIAVDREYAGRTYKSHFGSSLRVDAITLEY